MDGWEKGIAFVDAQKDHTPRQPNSMELTGFKITVFVTSETAATLQPLRHDMLDTECHSDTQVISRSYLICPFSSQSEFKLTQLLQ